MGDVLRQCSDANPFQAAAVHAMAAQEASTAPEAEQNVPVDVMVSEGAVYAIMQFNLQSNSLVPWTLKEVLASQNIPEDANVYLLTLRVARGQEMKDLQVTAAAPSWLQYSY
jgi:hypothetical protein